MHVANVFHHDEIPIPTAIEIANLISQKIQSNVNIIFKMFPNRENK